MNRQLGQQTRLSVHLCHHLTAHPGGMPIPKGMVEQD